MPIRAVLNVTYALLAKGLDAKARADFDSRLYGWDELNDLGNRVLTGVSGGEG
jgi:hypothetical protein